MRSREEITVGAVLEHASLLFGVLMFVSIVSMIFTLEYLDDEVFENAIPDFKFQRVLVGAVVSSTLSAMVHSWGVTRQNQEGSWVLMSMLLISQLVCCVDDNYAASASLREGFASGVARRQVAMWLGKRLAATLIALIVAVSFGVLKAAFKVAKWRRALLKAEMAEAEYPGYMLRRQASEDQTRRVILICFANVGSGHKVAAKAVEAAIEARKAANPERYGKVNVVLLDAMNLCPEPFRIIMQGMFQELTQSLAGQHMLGYLYDMGDGGRQKARFQAVAENLCLVPMLERIAEYRPDVVLCTHFLPAQLMATLRSRSRTLERRLPVATVLTDLDLQYMWVQKVDHMFVPREEARIMLDAYAAKGAPSAGAVSVVGIPIMPEFARHAAESPAARRSEAIKALAVWDRPETQPATWDPSVSGPWPPASWPPTWPVPLPWPAPEDARPIVVFMSSGNAVIEMYESLLGCRTALRLVVVTGRQADIRADLARVPVPARHAVKLLGYVTQMPTLLSCADLLVSKSGGLSVAEAAALSVPMVVLDPIPGQEQRNADVLLEAGAAVKINDLPLLGVKVDAVLRGERRAMMAKAIHTLAKPNAAFTIADIILDGELQPAFAEDSSMEPLLAAALSRNTETPNPPSPLPNPRAKSE